MDANLYCPNCSSPNCQVLNTNHDPCRVGCRACIARPPVRQCHCHDCGTNWNTCGFTEPLADAPSDRPGGCT
jgi:hypothetical protein